MNFQPVSAAMAILILGGFSAAVAEEPRGVAKVSVVELPSGGEAVIAKSDPQGGMHLICKTGHGPQYLNSTDGGATWSHPLAVVDHDSRKPGLEFDVWDMAVGPGGRVHLAVGTNAWKLKLPQTEWGYYFASLAPGEKHFSKLQNINHKPSEGFSLAADGKGNVTACWMADKLYANISHDNGETFAPYVEIDSTYDPCNCCTTSCTYAADGKMAILYREETDDQRDMYLVLWDQKKNTSSRTRVSTTPWQIDSCPMTYYSIAAARDGFVAAWPTKENIFFARLDSAGSLLSPEEIKTPGAPGMRSSIVVLPSAGGSILVAWKKDGMLGWQVYDSQGKRAGRSGSAKSAGKGVAAVVTKEGDFVLFR